MTEPEYIDHVETPYKEGYLNFNLGKLDDAIRKLSFNKPWVKALFLGIPSYFVGKALTPKLVGLVSPAINKATGIDLNSFQYMSPDDQKFIKRLVGGAFATAAMAPTVLHNIDFSGNKRHFGLSDFSPKTIEKNANFGMNPMQPAFNPYDPMQAIPLSTARESIMNNPGLTPMTKATSCAILNTFPSNTAVTGKDVVDRAISTGISGATNFAFGALTAHALGLPNPYTTAAMFTGISALT
jgi:hypothetical protein